MILKIVRMKGEKDQNGHMILFPFATEYYTLEGVLNYQKGTVDGKDITHIWTDCGTETLLRKASMQLDLTLGDRCHFFRWADTSLAVSHNDDCYLLENGKTVDRFIM